MTHWWSGVIGRLTIDKQNSNAYWFSCIDCRLEWWTGKMTTTACWQWNSWKGCKVHWIRSCQWVSEKVAFSCNRKREHNLFVNIIARQIPSLPSAILTIACFETLCSIRKYQVLQKEHPTLKMPDLSTKPATGALQNIGLSGRQDPTHPKMCLLVF